MPKFQLECLDNFIGQEHIKKVLKLEIAACKKTKERFPHTLLIGKAGCGKSSIARVLAEELGYTVTFTQGNRLRTPYSLLQHVVKSRKEDEDKFHIIFIDEIHEMPRRNQENLYTLMEEEEIDITNTKGVSAYNEETSEDTDAIDVPDFVIVGATTIEGMIEPPMRSRFKLQFYIQWYGNEEIERILRGARRKLAKRITDTVIKDIARKARGVPRIALGYLERLERAAFARNTSITKKLAEEIWDLLGVDKNGLRRQDFEVLRKLAEKNRPVGLKLLSAETELSERTLVDAIEPQLKRLKLMEQRSNGRAITDFGKKYLSSMGVKNGYKRTS